jgi:hypothetical protein
MIWLLVIVTAILVLFSSVLFFGAPFLPTLSPRIEDALDLLDLEPGQKLYELGSGDGRVLKAAAKRGIRAIGYEINPILVLFSKIYTWPERRLVSIHWKNYWHTSLAPADGLYVFLLDRYMAKLWSKIEIDLDHPLKMVSYAFAVPDVVPKMVRNGVKLYEFRPSKRSKG